MTDTTFSPASFTASAPVGIMSVAETAGTAETIVKNVMRVEPMLAGMAGMFIPGLSLVQPWIVMMAPYLERALDDIAKSNNGDVLTSMIELIQHVTKGQPNATILTPATSASGATDTGLDANGNMIRPAPGG